MSSNSEENLKAAEWAAWVLMGDPFARVPVTLQYLADRIAQAISQARIPLRSEIARLQRGDFTPEEFQALCHHRDLKPGCTRADFEAGCREYQRKLFGPTKEECKQLPHCDPYTGEDLTGKTEPCCECGNDYPAVDLARHGEVFCAECRAKEAKRTK